MYKRALEALNAAGVPYVVAGAYAIYEHTGIYRKTKDLDLFFEPRRWSPRPALCAPSGSSPGSRIRIGWRRRRSASISST